MLDPSFILMEPLFRTRIDSCGYDREMYKLLISTQK